MPSSSMSSQAGQFGPNEWLVEEMYQRFLDDPTAVDPAWHDFFADYRPGDGDTAPAGNGTAAPAAAPAKPVAEKSVTRAGRPGQARRERGDAEPTESGERCCARSPPPARPAPEKPAAGSASKAARPAPAVEEGTTTPLRGAASMVVKNMEASLEVPTATSVRAVPAKLLADNRLVINNQLRRTRGGKISFTHLIGFAVVRALAEFPVMNRHFTEIDGRPTVVAPDHVNLGLAIDLPGKGGGRSLVVVSIKGCESMNFAQFWSAYEAIVHRARTGALKRGRLHGHHADVDQPGHAGHEPLGAAADAGPGRDRRRRVDGVPGGVPGRQRGAARRDRHLQDHHADVDLRPPDHPGRGVGRVPAPDARAAAGRPDGRRQRVLRRDLHRAAGAVRAGALGAGHPRRRGRQDRPGDRADRRLPHPRAPDGRHGPAELPPAPPPRPRRALPRPDPVGPGPHVRHRRVRRSGAHEAARRARPAARLLRAHRRHRVHAHRGPGAAGLAAGTHRGAAPEARGGRAEVRSGQAERRRGVRDVPADQVRRPEALLPRRRGDRHPAARRRAGQGRRARAGRGRHRYAAPRPAQRAGQHRRQADLPDLPRVRGQPRPRPGPRLRGRQVPPRRRGQVLPDVRRRRDHRLAGQQPVAPGSRRPRPRRPRPRQAGPARQGRGRLHGDAADDARRRRVRRAGRGRRDAEPGAAARLPHRRHRARGHQQPGRVHHRPRGQPSARSTARTSRR